MKNNNYELAIEKNKIKCSWVESYGLVTELAQLVDAKKIVEIGVAYGYHAEHLLKTLPSVSYIGVDPYLAKYDIDDPFTRDVQKIIGELNLTEKDYLFYKFLDKKFSKIFGRNFSFFREFISSYPSEQEALDKLFSIVNSKLAYSKRAKIIREKSDIAANMIEDNSIDLVYIDGDHTYEGVLSDLNAWWGKVNQQTGIICGDDYCWYSVEKACNDFFNNKKLKYSLKFKEKRKEFPIWYYHFGQ